MNSEGARELRQRQSIDRSAVADALSLLAPHEFDAFLRWQDFDDHSAAELGSRTIRLLKFTGWQIVSEPVEGPVDGTLEAAGQRLVDRRRFGLSENFALAGADLLVCREATNDRTSGHVAVLSPDAVAGFMASCFPGIKLTRALQRVMVCYIAGLSLGQVAAIEGKSIDTIKSQSRELRRRLGLARTDDIARFIGTRLAIVVEKALGGDIKGRNADFVRYCKRYLPRQVRTAAFLDEDNQLHRILDMGPKNGVPVICLHPMILSDFREEDVALLEELKLRLIWPLRNGLIAPTDPILAEADHLRHACSGIETVRKLFFDGEVSILSFNASSKVALAYAKDNPDRVSTLFFAGICTQNEAVKGVRRVGRGMIALAGRNRPMMNAVADYLRRFVLTSERTQKFLSDLFKNRPADRAVLESELAGAFGCDRLRDALVGSTRSAVHDFVFQLSLGWEIARSLNTEMHFLHGEDNDIDPWPWVEALAADIAGATLHCLPGAGDLLYHQHFRSVLVPVAARLVQ